MQTRIPLMARSLKLDNRRKSARQGHVQEQRCCECCWPLTWGLRRVCATPHHTSDIHVSNHPVGMNDEHKRLPGRSKGEIIYPGNSTTVEAFWDGKISYIQTGTPVLATGTTCMRPAPSIVELIQVIICSFDLPCG